MSTTEAIVIGLVQGFTEFLPISSSGHLVIFQKILKINSPGNLIEVSAHLGTLLSIIFLYKNDIYNIILSAKSSATKNYIFMIILATMPSVVFVITSKSHILQLFESTRSVAIALIFYRLYFIYFRKKKILKSETKRCQRTINRIISGFCYHSGNIALRYDNFFCSIIGNIK